MLSLCFTPTVWHCTGCSGPRHGADRKRAQRLGNLATTGRYQDQRQWTSSMAIYVFGSCSWL